MHVRKRCAHELLTIENSVRKDGSNARLCVIFTLTHVRAYARMCVRTYKLTHILRTPYARVRKNVRKVSSLRTPLHTRSLFCTNTPSSTQLQSCNSWALHCTCNQLGTRKTFPPIHVSAERASAKSHLRIQLRHAATYIAVDFWDIHSFFP